MLGAPTGVPGSQPQLLCFTGLMLIVQRSLSVLEKRRIKLNAPRNPLMQPSTAGISASGPKGRGQDGPDSPVGTGMCRQASR